MIAEPDAERETGQRGERPHNGCFPEYHTSADDLELVRPGCLADSLAKVLAAFEVLEGDAVYRSLNPHGEPQLGRRGLFDRAEEWGLLWTLNLADGRHSLLDVAERSGMDFRAIKRGADALRDRGLLEELPENPAGKGA